jgi:hypothetical protein
MRLVSSILARALLGASAASLLGACVELPPAEPLLVTQRGAQRILTFEVESPDPREGLNELIIRVTEDGAPVGGLEVQLELWMDDPSGTYRAEVVFAMPGTWTVQLRADGEVGDSCVIFVEVQ